MLGPRPCLADFALAGACKAHFVTDPVPVSWLGEFRDMLFAYTQRLFGERRCTLADGPRATPFPTRCARFQPITRPGHLFAFARANIAAGLARGKVLLV
ncbi:MAG: hypothetical protein R3E50_10090 [Halioglobus sp.]